MRRTRKGLFDDKAKSVKWTKQKSTPKSKKKIGGRKKRITTASAKDKGRRLQKWVAQQISRITGIECGKDCLIESREMGQDGVDVKLYGIAEEKFPFSVECKYQEQWALPAYIKQAKANIKKGTDWILFIKKNRYEELVVMNAETFFDIYGEYIKHKFGEDE